MSRYEAGLGRCAIMSRVNRITRATASAPSPAGQLPSAPAPAPAACQTSVAKATNRPPPEVHVFLSHSRSNAAPLPAASPCVPVQWNAHIAGGANGNATCRIARHRNQHVLVGNQTASSLSFVTRTDARDPTLGMVSREGTILYCTIAASVTASLFTRTRVSKANLIRVVHYDHCSIIVSCTSLLHQHRQWRNPHRARMGVWFPDRLISLTGGYVSHACAGRSSTPAVTRRTV